jgi:hypothetical protein
LILYCQILKDKSRTNIIKEILLFVSVYYVINNVIVSADGDDQSTGNGGEDIFACGEGEDTVTDYNQAEGDIATPDCENF